MIDDDPFKRVDRNKTLLVIGIVFIITSGIIIGGGLLVKIGLQSLAYKESCPDEYLIKTDEGYSCIDVEKGTIREIKEYYEMYSLQGG